MTDDTLKSLWSGVLNGASILPDSDFFELGGDSLAAMNLLFALEKKLGVELHIATLYENSSFSAFSDVVAGARKSG
jgi:acyl carrier protein